MIRISKMAAAVQPSATLAAGAKARQLKAAGRQRSSTSASASRTSTRPNTSATPPTRRCAQGQTHYTPAGGTAELRRRDRARGTSSTYGFECGPEQVIVSNGAKHSIHNALAATVGPGDEVIIPTPYWVSYSDLVQMTGATPVLVADDAGERLQDDARPSCRPRSRRARGC